MNAAANLLEKHIGPHPDATTEANANPSNDPDKFADPSGETMKALAWMGKNKVEIVEALKPKLVDETDVVLKVTGSTVCGECRVRSFCTSKSVEADVGIFFFFFVRLGSPSLARSSPRDAEGRHPWPRVHGHGRKRRFQGVEDQGRRSSGCFLQHCLW